MNKKKLNHDNTSALRMKKLRERRNEMAKSIGYDSFTKMLTSMNKKKLNHDYTCALRMKRLRERRNEMAKSIGYDSYTKMLTAMVVSFENGNLKEWLTEKNLKRRK